MTAAFSTFVIEYPDDKARREGVAVMFDVFPFMSDDADVPHTVAVSMGDRIETADIMLAALEAVDRMFSEPGTINKSTVRDQVRAAIAKATPA